MATVITVNPVPALSPQVESARSSLNALSMVLMLSGCASLVSFWASYYLGFVLSVGAIITGYTQYAHTKDANAMVNCHTVVNARTAFNTIQSMNYIGVILGMISLGLSGYALYVWSLFMDMFMLYFVFAVLACVAALVITAAAAMSANHCGTLHREMLVLIPAPCTTAVAPGAAAAGAYVQMPAQQQQQAYGAQPAVYGAPVQPQAAAGVKAAPEPVV